MDYKQALRKVVYLLMGILNLYSKIWVFLFFEIHLFHKDYKPTVKLSHERAGTFLIFTVTKK